MQTSRSPAALSNHPGRRDRSSVTRMADTIDLVPRAERPKPPPYNHRRPCPIDAESGRTVTALTRARIGTRHGD